MVHEDIGDYLRRQLPLDFLSYEELCNWRFGPPGTSSLLPDRRIGMGLYTKISLLCSQSCFPAHTLGHYQLIYAVSGSFAIQSPEDSCILSAGDALLIAPGFSHSLCACGQADYGAVISMDAQLMEHWLDLGDLPAFVEFMHIHEEGQAYAPTQPFLRFYTGERPDARWYLEELLCEHLEPDRRTYLAYQSLLQLAMIALDRCADCTARNRRNASQQTVDAVMRYLKSNFSTATLEDTARRFGFSPNYFSHVLKKATGKSFQTIKQDICLTQSAFMLATTDYTIAQVATAVGMGNLTRFYKLFAQRFGMSPANYRRAYRNHTPELSGVQPPDVAGL